MSVEDFYVRDGLPVGLRSADPMPYGFRRWNGTVWCNAWVDTYNAELRRAIVAHRQGLDDKAQRHVEALYMTGHHFDRLAKELLQSD